MRVYAKVKFSLSELKKMENEENNYAYYFNKYFRDTLMLEICINLRKYFMFHYVQFEVYGLINHLNLFVRKLLNLLMRSLNEMSKCDT